MKPLVIEGTADTPYICLDKTGNIFEIYGASLPANIFEFYRPVLDWLTKYCRNPNHETDLKLKFEYLNSSSTKMVHTIISVLEQILDKGLKVRVSWFYDHGDMEMKEMGEDFASSCNISFKLIAAKQDGLN